MDDKLTFFEQVLELDPDSKLFFELARLYFEHNQIPKARDTLSKGLKRHPQHFEAKLLLATILTHEGEQEQARQICRDIFALFRTNRDFWNNLSTILYNQGEKDLSLAAAFFARSGSSRAITWADVLQAGLDSLGEKFDHSQPFNAEDISVTDDSQIPDPASQEPLQNEDPVHQAREDSPEILPDSKKTESEPVGFDLTDEQDIAESTPEQKPELQDYEQDDKSFLAEAREFDVAGEPQDHPEIIDIDQEVITELPSDEPYLTDTAEDSVKQDFMERDDEYEDPEELTDFDIGSEARTKSMADILFRQDEYAKALDIYRELWRASLPGKERKDLEELITAAEQAILLQEKEGEQDRISPDKDTAAESKDKEEAINFLMALADRLEAKSRQ